MADIIDINVSKTTETVTINSTPNLTTININTVTGGAVSSVNGQTGDVVIATSDNNFTNALKTKLDGIATGAEVNVNADWNATSGDAQILNKPTIPTQTSQLTNNGADGTNPFITALDIPTAGQAGTLVREVKNMTGATLNKGTVVYISGANGNKPLVSKALATSDALSARTFGLLQSNISNNGVGYCVIIGDLTGLDTSAYTEGVQLYLSGVTAGTYTSTKTLAPTHLVYIGKVTRSHPTLGQIEVGIQNGYELEEIHDVAITSVADKQLLSYDLATDLWKNKSVTTDDIADSTNKRYQTDNQNSFNDATSSIQTQLNAKATDSAVVHLAGTETISGQKTFSASVDISNGTDSIRLSRTAGAAGRLIFSRPGTIATQAISIGGGNSELSIGSNDAKQLKANGVDLEISNTETNGNIIITSGVGTTGGIILRGNSNTNGLQFFSSTKNVVLQNGGTFTDVASSRLTVNSTTQGILPPRMTTAQKIAISSPATGLVVYDTDLKAISNYNGTSWVSLTPTAPSQQVYTGTITWTGTTAPSGATNHTYNWSLTNNLVTLKITLVYATIGSALTAVSVTLPTDCPTPLKPTGLTAASNILYTGNGLFLNSLTGVPSASNRVLFKSNAANNGFEINSNGPSGGYLFTDIIVQYFTS